MAERFYFPQLNSEQEIVLTGPEAHHLARVCRAKVGTEIELFDGASPVAVGARVAEVSSSRVVCQRTGRQVADRVPQVELTLGVAFPRGERLDWLVEKAVELGVARLQPIVTARSVVDPRPTKLDRLRRSVVEASKQCGRNRLMPIEPPQALAVWAAQMAPAARLFAHPGGQPLEAAPAWPPAANVCLAIGPEGGFDPAEVDQLRALGWSEFGLGATILRIETAAIAAAALILNRPTLGASPR